MNAKWGIGIAVVSAAAFGAQADTYSFGNITNNGGVNIAAQLSVDVTDAGGGNVDFHFVNNVGIQSSVAEVYFDDGNPPVNLFSGFILSQNGATFTYGSASPGDLPGGNSLADPFEVSLGFLADKGAGNPSGGLDTAADFLTIRFSLNGGITFADVIAAMNSGALRVGMHVISIDGDFSDGFVTCPDCGPPPPGVPLPSAFAAGLAGLGLVAGRRRR